MDRQARAERVQGSAAIEIAARELPGVVEAGLLDLIDVLAIRVIVVAVDFVATAVGHGDDGAEPVEEIVILLAVGRALVVQQTTATARKVRRATGIGARGESQSRVDEGVR